LNVIHVTVLEAENGDIEENDKNVDKDEMIHEVSGAFLVTHHDLQFAEPESLDDIE
jgi:hypothetical protein